MKLCWEAMSCDDELPKSSDGFPNGQQRTSQLQMVLAQRNIKLVIVQLPINILKVIESEEIVYD